MSLTLPVFKNTHCVALRACGKVKTDDKALLEWMDAQKTMIASVKMGSDKCFVRTSFGGRLGNHLNIDVSKQNIYQKAFQPKSPVAIDEIHNALDRFMGMEVEVDHAGLFEINLDELPEGGIIRSLFFQTQTGNVSIKVTGAQFSITGAPVDLISWRAITGDKIGITIESENVKRVISESFLIAALQKLESALNVFVLGKPPHEQK